MSKENNVVFEYCEMQYDSNRLKVISYGDNSRQSISVDNIDDYSATAYRYFERDPLQYGFISFAIGAAIYIAGLFIGGYVNEVIGSVFLYIGFPLVIYFVVIFFFDIMFDSLFGTNVALSIIRPFFGTECIYVEVYSKNGNNGLEFYVGEDEADKLENTMRVIKSN